MGPLDKTLDALGRFFDVLVRNFGQGGAIGIVLGAVLAFFVWRWFAMRMAERGWREALDEKERSIQRLAQIERSYRIETLVNKGMSVAEAERIVLGAGTGGTPAVAAGIRPPTGILTWLKRPFSKQP